jgi:hypothetical protein
METPQEYATSQVRRLMTVLFSLRAKRHLRSLADLYGWTPEQLAAHEARFITTQYCVPEFSTEEDVVRRQLARLDED